MRLPLKHIILSLPIRQLPRLLTEALERYRVTSIE